jgi:hypothetical protein
LGCAFDSIFSAMFTSLSTRAFGREEVRQKAQMSCCLVECIARIWRCNVPCCFQGRFRTSRPVDAFKREEEIQSGSFEQPLRFWQPSGMAKDEGWLAIEGHGYANDKARELGWIM